MARTQTNIWGVNYNIDFEASASGWETIYSATGNINDNGKYAYGRGGIPKFSMNAVDLDWGQVNWSGILGSDMPSTIDNTSDLLKAIKYASTVGGSGSVDSLTPVRLWNSELDKFNNDTLGNKRHHITKQVFTSDFFDLNDDGNTTYSNEEDTINNINTYSIGYIHELLHDVNDLKNKDLKQLRTSVTRSRTSIDANKDYIEYIEWEDNKGRSSEYGASISLPRIKITYNANSPYYLNTHSYFGYVEVTSSKISTYPKLSNSSPVGIYNMISSYIGTNCVTSVLPYEIYKKKIVIFPQENPVNIEYGETGYIYFSTNAKVQLQLINQNNNDNYEIYIQNGEGTSGYSAINSIRESYPSNRHRIKIINKNQGEKSYYLLNKHLLVDIYSISVDDASTFLKEFKVNYDKVLKDIVVLKNNIVEEEGKIKITFKGPYNESLRTQYSDDVVFHNVTPNLTLDQFAQAEGYSGGYSELFNSIYTENLNNFSLIGFYQNGTSGVFVMGTDNIGLSDKVYYGQWKYNVTYKKSSSTINTYTFDVNTIHQIYWPGASNITDGYEFDYWVDSKNNRYHPEGKNNYFQTYNGPNITLTLVEIPKENPSAELSWPTAYGLSLTFSDDNNNKQEPWGNITLDIYSMIKDKYQGKYLIPEENYTYKLLDNSASLVTYNTRFFNSGETGKYENSHAWRDNSATLHIDGTINDNGSDYFHDFEMVNQGKKLNITRNTNDKAELIYDMYTYNNKGKYRTIIVVYLDSSRYIHSGCALEILDTSNQSVQINDNPLLVYVDAAYESNITNMDYPDVGDSAALTFNWNMTINSSGVSGNLYYLTSGVHGFETNLISDSSVSTANNTLKSLKNYDLGDSVDNRKVLILLWESNTTNSFKFPQLTINCGLSTGTSSTRNTLVINGLQNVNPSNNNNNNWGAFYTNKIDLANELGLNIQEMVYHEMVI